MSGVQKHVPSCTACACGSIVFTVQGCGVRALAGATVTVYDGSANTFPVLTSGTTDSLGNFTAAIASAKTYYYEVAKSPRFTLKSGTIAATCTTNNLTVTMSANVASGYHCQTGFAGSCADPLADTLTVVDPNYGSATMTYDGTFSPAGWVGCRIITFGTARDGTCANPASRSVAIKYVMPVNGGLQVWVGACASGFNHFPQQTDCTTVNAGHDSGLGTYVISSCSPYAASVAASRSAGTSSDAFETVYGTGPHTFTLSE